ncbi:MAG: hypothetical protein AB1635_15585 [Acidobacteriota bacterium]
MKPATQPAALAFVALLAVPAVAQPADDAPTLRARRLTASIGGLWLGGYDVGSRAATLRGPGSGPTPPPFTLFTVDGAFAGAGGVEARLGVTLAPRWSVEVSGTYARPRLAADVGGDGEAGAVSFEGERISQYTVEGSLVWDLGPRLGARARPYLIGGGGYLRQLHEDRVLVVTGQVYHGGGGVRYWLRGADGSRLAVGVRGEARIVARRRGIDFTGDVRVYPTAHGLVFLVF